MYHEAQDPQFKNKAREYDDGKSFIQEIRKNCDWAYTDYVPPGTHRNHLPTWKYPSCKKMVQHLRICGGEVSFMMGIIADGIPCNMRQLYAVILEEFEKPENEDYFKEWQRIIRIGEKVQERFGDDALLRQYKEGTIKPGVAQILAGKRKGSASTAPAKTAENDAGLAMLADLASGEEE